MKTKTIILILFLLLMAALNMGSVVAEDMGEIDIVTDINDNNLIANGIDANEQYAVNEYIDDEIELQMEENAYSNDNDPETINDETAKSLQSSSQQNNLQSTITVDGKATNQMENRTIQDAIDNANPGDTIIITGKRYEHCHFIIDKPLTIISEVGTRMTPCPANNNGSGYYGVFYISPEASGTTLKGFFITNTLARENYGIYVNGADNVLIENCTINTTKDGEGILIIDSKNSAVKNSIIRNSSIGISLIRCENTKILNNDISNNTEYGISLSASNRTEIDFNNINKNNKTGIYIGTNNNNTNIYTNNITNNTNKGIEIYSANYVYITNNFIAYNREGDNFASYGVGIYVNCNLTKLEITGNFIKQNGQYGILNDYLVENMLAKSGADKLEIVNNNYFLGHNTKLTYHYTFKPKAGGDYIYDEEIGDYRPVRTGETGTHYLDGTIVYLKYNFLRDEYICGSTYYNKDTFWREDDFQLYISEITQVKKGTYQVSLVNSKGVVASELSSIYVTFYLNKNNKYAEPQAGDVYKTVLMKNGTATVTFTEKDYLESGNVLLASFPGLWEEYKVNNAYVTYNISDADIPKDSVATKISISNMSTYPNSGAYISAKLKDSLGNPLFNKTIKFSLNGKTYSVKTDKNGNAKLQVKLPSQKTYTISVSFAGEEGYNKTSSSAKIVVKKTKQKIISSNKSYAPKVTNYYKITLKDQNNKVIANKKITVKIGTKKYTKTTNKKGTVSIKIKYSKKKTYKVTIKSAATNKYSAISKTNYIKIKRIKQKITSSNKAYAPNSVNYYKITLKDQNNKAIANKKITVKIGAKTYKKTTNKNGTVSIKIKYSKKKTYKVTIKSPKTSKYLLKTKTNKIVIRPLKQTITSSNKKCLPQSGDIYKISLKDENKKAIANKKVKITLNSKTYNVKTNKKGVAQIKINLTKEKVYTLKIKSAATKQYKAADKTNKITIQKATPSLTSYNRTYSNNSGEKYYIYLKDYNGKALSSGKISFTVDNETYNATTDTKGVADLKINIENPGDYTIVTKFLGNIKNKAISATNRITIREGSDISFIDNNLPNTEIQKIIKDSASGNTIEFLGEKYDGVYLNIDKPLNIISNIGTQLNGASNGPVIKINSDDVNLSSFNIVANSLKGESDGILINNSANVSIFNNTITNNLNSTRISGYNNGSTILPGEGIKIINSENIKIDQNTISSFESGIYNEFSKDLYINGNTLKSNNYGIKYGFGSSNTEIIKNTITENIGWYVMNVPEGPRGYGIFLNNSAVNITITQNNISNNYLGISLDANNTTGIVITSNLIADNSLEGIRFNAPYDLAEDAVEPIVTDNAIYRNAKGPSMMILGEMSANPEGIYGIGVEDPEKRLRIGLNWYGVNSLQTWDNDTGIVGVGTMCPRINTHEIKFETIECESPGTYKINFYKEGELATDLARFDIYATLNRGNETETEVHFEVINGTGTFSFDSSNYLEENNKIEISVGSILNVVDRYYQIIYSYSVPENEIPS